MGIGNNRKRIRARVVFSIIITIITLTVLILAASSGNEFLSRVFNSVNERDVLHGDIEWEGTGNIPSSPMNRGAASQVRNFVADLKEYIAALEGRYGIYFLDISSGLEFGVNENDEFYAASTVKIPLALFLAIQMEEGTIKPDKILEYTVQDFESGCGSLQYGEFGTKHTVLELIELSLRVSDNIAANMLLRAIGYSNLKDFMRSIGGRVVDEDRNITCPKDMALYMLKVYSFSLQSAYGEIVLSHLKNTVFNDRLPALLPNNVQVAHKIGNWHDSYHDVGIVFTENPYVISIMSEGSSAKDAYREIGNISRMIFDFFS